jgi:hypothetical protein
MYDVTMPGGPMEELIQKMVKTVGIEFLNLPGGLGDKLGGMS